ncbi:unnamed protein product [Amoebophrya sp. A25]|nr:unnamed protein product [Amoebophrya sp. A25]|eukprot:GSA25T00017679001.1
MLPKQEAVPVSTSLLTDGLADARALIDQGQVRHEVLGDKLNGVDLSRVISSASASSTVSGISRATSTSSSFQERAVDSLFYDGENDEVCDEVVAKLDANHWSLSEYLPPSTTTSSTFNKVWFPAPTPAPADGTTAEDVVVGLPPPQLSILEKMKVFLKHLLVKYWKDAQAWKEKHDLLELQGREQVAAAPGALSRSISTLSQSQPGCSRTVSACSDSGGGPHLRPPQQDPEKWGFSLQKLAVLKFIVEEKMQVVFVLRAWLRFLLNNDDEAFASFVDKDIANMSQERKLQEMRSLVHYTRELDLLDTMFVEFGGYYDSLFRIWNGGTHSSASTASGSSIAETLKQFARQLHADESERNPSASSRCLQKTMTKIVYLMMLSLTRLSLPP